MTSLLSVRDAQQKILSAIQPASPEPCPVEAAYGRILAEDIRSPLNLPAFTNSSMDGFAVHSRDVASAAPSSPVRLPVAADIPAGSPIPAPLKPGEAARILTGAPLPPGADAVVPVEDTDQADSRQSTALPNFVSLFAPVKPGTFLRSVGEDVKNGQRILSAGRVLQPQDIGLLISLGIRQVQVMRKPRLALFSSGDELLTPGQPLTPGKLYDANRYVLTGLLNAAGAGVIQLGIARDSRQSVLDTLDKALPALPDLILSTAGVSVGVFDFVQQVIRENGGLSFWKVNMRPGKPVAFGNYKGIPFLGLPGNPVSAYVSCLVLVLPIIRKLQGLPPFQQTLIQAVLTEPLESPDGRETYYRGVIRSEQGVIKASLTGQQSSGNLYSLVKANALLIMPEGVKSLAAGESIAAWVLDPGWENQ